MSSRNQHFSGFGFSTADMQSKKERKVSGSRGEKLAAALKPVVENLEPRQMLSAGTPDTSFNPGGKRSDDTGFQDLAHATLIEPNGKSLVAGESQGRFALLQYNNDGSLNWQALNGPGFPLSSVSAMTMQGGKIIVAGTELDSINGDSEFAVARYNDDGTLDTSFGNQGTAVTDLGADTRDTAYGVAVQSDGKIVVVGSTGGAGQEDVALVRYTSEGELDNAAGTGFGAAQNGIVTMPQAGSESVNAVAIGTGDEIIVAGHDGLSTLIQQYEANGILQITHAQDIGGTDSASGIAVQGSKFVVGGTANGDFYAVRFDSSLTLDSGFGSSGVANVDFGGTDSASGLTIAPDGKIVLAGTTDNGASGTQDFAVARLSADGTPDASFGVGGMTTVDFNGQNDVGAAVAVGADRKIVVAGYSAGAVNNDFAVTRLEGNSAPVIGTATANLDAINEDATANTGNSVAELAGRLEITDADGDVAGLAITGSDDSNGSWEYTSDGGTDWAAIGVVTPGSALLLSADAQNRIRFVPAADFNTASGPTPALSVVAWDGLTGSNGGTADVTDNSSHLNSFGNTTGTLEQPITAVNDAPSFIAGADQTVLAGSGPQTVSGWATNISKGPADENGQTLTFVMSEIPDPNGVVSGVSIDPITGTLTFTPSSTPGVATISVSLKDNGGGTDTSTPQTLTITVAELGTETWVNDNWVVTNDVGTPGLSQGDTVADSEAGDDGAVTGKTYGIDAFSTVQDGIDFTAASGTVHVISGTYVEDVNINKSLTVLGQNAGVNPNTGVRGAEAILRPATSNPDPFSPTAEIVLYVSASNVTIDGLVVDGDNTASTSGILVKGVDVDASEGIAGFDGVSQLAIQNTIVRNTAYTGIDFDNYTSNGAATSDNHITDNRMSNIGYIPYGYGIGVLLYDNFYAEVAHNVMTDVRTGVQTGNFYQANPGSTASISDNDITATRKGIFHNLAYGSASPFTISNNQITAADEAGVGRWDGIMLSSLQDGVDAIVTGNIISAGGVSQTTVGYQVWNTPTTADLTISGGSVTGATYGVWANNFDGYPTATGSNADDTHVHVSGVDLIDSTTAGIFVSDNPANSNGATVSVEVDGDTSISGPATGILVQGSDASANIHDNSSLIQGGTIGMDVDGGTAAISGNHIYNNSIAGIRFINGGAGSVTANGFDDGVAGDGAQDNATDLLLDSSAGTVAIGDGNQFAADTFFIDNQTAQSFDISGSGTTFDQANNFRIEDKMFHKIDDASKGLITWVANNIFITTPGAGSTDSSIQRGIDAATAGDTVNVEDGTYTEQVDIGKDLTLKGQSQSGTIIKSPTSLANSFEWSGITYKPVVLAHDATVNVALLTVDGDGQGNANNRFTGIGYYNAGGSIDHTTVVGVRDSSLDGAQHGYGIIARDDDSVARTLDITNNTVSDYQKNGIDIRGARIDATISDNTVTGGGDTDLIAQNGIVVIDAKATITGNTVSGNEYSGPTGGADPANNDQATGILLLPAASSSLIDGNTIDGNDIGIYSLGSGTTISNNHLGTSEANRYEGILVDSGDTTIIGNSIIGGNFGIATLPGSTTNVTATDNTVSGAGIGIDINDATGDVSGNHLYDNQTAIQFSNGGTGSVDGNDFVGGVGNSDNGTDLSLASDAGTVTIGADNHFASDTFFINNQTAQDFNLVGNGTTFDVSNNFRIEDKMFHKVDDASKGLITWIANNIFITTPGLGSTDSSIQRGIDAASNGDTVNIENGTYAESNIAVDKSVAIAGQSRAGVILSPGIVDGHVDDNFTSASNGFLIGASGVTIKNLTIDGNANPALGGTQNFRNAILTNYLAGDFGNIAVDNVTINNIFRKGVGFYVTSDNKVAGDSVTNSSFYGIGTDASLSFESYAAIAAFQSDTTISNVIITNSGAGISTNYFTSEANAPKLTISGVQISGMHTDGSNPIIGMDLSGLADGSSITASDIDVTGGNADIGLVVQYTATGADVTVSGNTITTDAGDTGILLYQNANAAHPTLVSDNTFTGTASETGILVTNNGAVFGETPNVGTTYAMLSHNNVSGYGVGVSVTGANSTAAIDGNYINHNGTGIQFISGGQGSVTGNEFDGGVSDNGTDLLLASDAGAVAIGANNHFAGDTFFINNQTAQNINLAGNGTAFDESNNFRIEDKMFHKVDDASKGLITWVANNIFITTPGAGSTDSSIQRGIDAATAGDTVNVEAGTYVENPNVNKSLTLLGANASVAGSATRGDETIVRSSGLSNTAVFMITANNVEISGFTLDGDDPNFVGVTLASGEDTNTSYGVRPTGAFNHITVDDNIIKHVAIGFRGDGASQNNVIANNWFDSVGFFDFGYGISLRQSYYADITDNLMTRVWTGVHLNDFHLAGGPTTWTMSGNEIHSYAGGLLYWLQYGQATSLTIDNNDFSAETGATANNFGVLMVSIQDTIHPTFTNNSVTGQDYGIGLFNVSTSNPITLDGTNSVADSKLAGVLLTDNLNFNPVGTTNFLAGGPGAASTVNINDMSITGNLGDGVRVDASLNTPQTVNIVNSNITGVSGSEGVEVVGAQGAASLDNTSISGFTAGVKDTGGKLTIGTGVSITGGTTGLAISGSTAVLSGQTLNDLALTGQNGRYISLSDNALDDQEIDATGVKFDGATGATVSYAQNFAIEDKIDHAVDDLSLGFIRVKAGNVFVTTNSGSIQRGVDVASDGDQVNVADGTYTEQVDIGKDLTLQGQSQSGTIIKSPTSLANSFEWSGITYKPVVMAHDATVNVALLTVDGDGQGNSNNRFTGIGYYNAGGSIDHTTEVGVRDSSLDGVQHGYGIIARDDDAVARTLDITNNTVSDYQKNGIDVRGAGIDATISGNTVTGAGDTDVLAQNGIVVIDAKATITGNTVSGNEYSGPTGGADPVNNDQAIGILLLPAADGSLVDGNTINGNDIGIYSQGSGITVSNNHLGDTEANRYEGILVDSGDTTITGNSIAGGNFGIATLPGSTVSVTVTGNTISVAATGTGIFVNNATLTVGAGNIITGGTTGLAISGAGSGITGKTLSDLSFTGQSGQYIALSDNALDDQEIDATAVSFDGITGATATNAQLQAIENKIHHEVDDATLGFIRVKAVDTTRPTVVASEFHFENAPQRITIQFSEDVGNSLSLDDITLTELLSNTTISSDNMTLTYDEATRTATITFHDLPANYLPTGRYKLTVNSAGVTDGSGNPLDGDGNGGDHVLTFFQLNGDANRDETVDFDDLVVVGQNYGLNDGSQTWATGDFNYDGVVDFADLVAIAQNYNTTLPPAPPLTAPPVSAASVAAPVVAAAPASAPVVAAAPVVASPVVATVVSTPVLTVPSLDTVITKPVANNVSAPKSKPVATAVASAKPAAIKAAPLAKTADKPVLKSVTKTAVKPVSKPVVSAKVQKGVTPIQASGNAPFAVSTQLRTQNRPASLVGQVLQKKDLETQRVFR